MNNLNYGIIGNCRTAALISEKGNIEWLCFPEFDSPSVFAALLDREKGGCFGFEVSEKYHTVQSYIPHTNILSTQFISDEGEFVVLDFMPYYRSENNEHYLPAELYRYIHKIKGKPRFRINYSPAPNYAQGKVIHNITPDFIESYCSLDNADRQYLYSSLPLKEIEQKKEFLLEKDEFLLLSYNEKVIPVDLEREKLEYCRTLVHWLNWSSRTKKYSLYNDIIERSLLVLKLMSHYNGAELAAITTSIPETIGEVRNWDYRFCWLRDASMSIETLFQIGHAGAARRFMKFIQSTFTAKHESFQIMYGLRGERHLTEVILDHLSGYKNSKPVRIGNDAYHQKQNDSFGYLMDLIYQYYRLMPGSLDEIEDMWEMVKSILYTVSNDWRKPDKENIQSFTQTYDNEAMDASLLLMEPYGFIGADDIRYHKTVKAVKKALLHKGLMYRYNSKDDFGLPSSAFTICTFWLVRALFVIGEKNEARCLFDEILKYSNHLGLFSEDLNFDTKEQLGNFPQAYSHLALVNTAILFAEEDKTQQFIRS